MIYSGTPYQRVKRNRRHWGAGTCKLPTFCLSPCDRCFTFIKWLESFWLYRHAEIFQLLPTYCNAFGFFQKFFLKTRLRKYDNDSIITSLLNYIENMVKTEDVQHTFLMLTETPNKNVEWPMSGYELKSTCIFLDLF